MSYKDRLSAVIPGGAHTYSRGNDQFPSNAPEILLEGKGAYVWDAEGNKYLDYGMGLRSVTLGYAHPIVNGAAIEALEKGNNLTRASMLELEAAEAMVNLIPSADMVKFAKNGSNVTTAALKMARSYTGKRYICIPKEHPFFSFDDWFIGTTPMKRGIPQNHSVNTLLFQYGDFKSLSDLFVQYPGQIAGVMLEPATTVTPCPSFVEKLRYDSSFAHETNFLHQVQTLCEENQTVFILDEMITGFRWHEQGAQTYFGVKPDISTFGKGMGNGFSIAAMVGKRSIMELGSIHVPNQERTFLLSSTHGGEMSSLGAFLGVQSVYQSSEVCKHLWSYGENLVEAMKEIIKENDLQDHFRMEGPFISLNYVTLGEDGQISLPFRTLFAQEMIRNGVLMPWIAVSLAHGNEELEKTIQAAQSALRVYRKALDEGIDKYLIGGSIKPVFRKNN